MCRKHNHQYATQTQFFAASPHIRQRRNGCRNSKVKRNKRSTIPTTPPIRQQRFSDNYYVPQPQQPLSLSNADQEFRAFNPKRGINRRKKCRGPISGMAALLITGIAIGAQKIQEKREQKKAKKAALEWEEQRSFETARAAALKDAREVKREERRKSEEAEEEQRRSRSVSAEREAPPSYESAVAGTRVEEGRSSRTMSNV